MAVFKWLIAAVWVAFINFSRTFLSNMFQEKFFTFCGHARMLITCLPSFQASRFFINSLPTAVLHVSEGTMFFTLRSRSCKNFYAKSIINLEWILIMVHQWVFKVYTVEPCYLNSQGKRKIVWNGLKKLKLNESQIQGEWFWVRNNRSWNFKLQVHISGIQL